MYEEKNTRCNLPARIDLFATQGEEYRFLFMAKRGGLLTRPSSTR
jgi:fumarate hydratase class I